MNFIDLPDVREPMWQGNMGRKVGIATWRITNPSQVYRFGISWKNKADEQRYPKKYVMRGRDIQRYEAKPLKKYPDTYIHWIPIADLTTEIPKDICIEHNAIKLPDGRCVMEVAL